MSAINANLLTVMVGIAGILASYLLYLLGIRKAKAENDGLHSDIAAAREALQNLVRVRSKDSGRGGAATVASSATEPLSEAAAEELLRASLGALVNERGDVDMTRLRREIAAVVGPSHLTDVLSGLERLRAQGIIWWDGTDDLTRVRLLHVRPAQRPDGADLPSIANS